MLKQGLTPVYSFADRSVAMGARPEHYEVIAEVLPVALEVRSPFRDVYDLHDLGHFARWGPYGLACCLGGQITVS